MDWTKSQEAEGHEVLSILEKVKRIRTRTYLKATSEQKEFLLGESESPGITLSLYIGPMYRKVQFFTFLLYYVL